VADLKSPKKLPGVLVLASALMLAAAGASYALKPTHMMADEKPPVILKDILPTRFGDWQEDTSIIPLTVDPTVEAKLETLYSQTLNRTYVNSKGEHIMLSIAYGKNQNSQSTAAHRPEFCYSGHGFHVEKLGYDTTQLKGRQLRTVRLLADKEERIEPITYWVTLSDEAIVPGVERKLAQLRYGLRGQIVDGMLVRISSISNDKRSVDFSSHQQFMRDLEQALPEDMKPRFLGS
jgi:EpsI family protein